MSIRRATVALLGAALILAAVAAYRGSFAVPLLLDDPSSIVDNPTLRHLWPPGSVLSPPSGEGLTVEGRPVLNLSLAVNYAISGTSVWSYHALNLLIHALAGLTLFGLLRRVQPSVGVAFAASLLWAVHPLLTESVTYIIQRAESLMGLFYLLTLYAFIRGVRKGASRVWLPASVLCCLLGMGTKEVMVSAPLMVLLYDRTCVAGGFRRAWRERRPYYAALASTWIPLAYLVAGAGSRGGTSGFGSGVSVAEYWPTQAQAFLEYLRLSVWPHPLIFDYGVDWSPPRWSVAAGAVLLLALGGATLVSLWKRRAAGLLGVWLIFTLAPTSLIPGNRQTIAEHRMYLGLVAPIFAVVLGTYAVARGRRLELPPARRWALVLATGGVALGLGFLTFRRNADYRSERILYADTVSKRPSNAFAQANYGTVLLADGRVDEAVACLERAVELNPAYPIAQDNLGNALQQDGRLGEAVGHYQAALRLDPGFVAAHDNLGGVYLGLGRSEDAAREFGAALRLRPADAEAHNGSGILAAAAGRLDEALGHYRAALAADPDCTAARYNLGNALLDAGRWTEAISAYKAVLERQPSNAGAHDNLGNALLRQGRVEEAAAEYRAVLRLDPDHAVAHYNLGNALQGLGRIAEAVAEYREALRLKPDFSAARQKVIQCGGMED